MACDTGPLMTLAMWLSSSTPPCASVSTFVDMEVILKVGRNPTLLGKYYGKMMQLLIKGGKKLIAE